MSNAHHSLNSRATKCRVIKRCRQLITVGIFIFFTAIISPAAIALGLDEAVKKVQTELGGKVLDVQQVTVKNSPAYRIKLLQPSGRVKVLLLDAKSGSLLSDTESNP